MFTKKDWLPKRICVPRKSVSIDDSSSWVYSFGPTNSLRPKRSFRRVAPDSGIVINTKNQDEGCINISPTSSPEGETLEFGHQLLSIENLDEPISSNEFQQLQNLISSNCSSSVSSQNENAVICEYSQPSSLTEVIYQNGFTNLDESDFDSLCYLTELQRDCSELPYKNLTVKSLPRRISSNSILRKLHHLVKRNSSERSIWLHQRSTQNILDSTKHTSKTFQILRVFRNYSDNLPGLVAFGVREVVTHLENETETFDVNENVSNKFAMLLLPISGVPFGAEELFSSTATNFVLGNDLKCGDFVMIFSPWSTYPSHEFNSLPVLHSFFWVERLKHEVLSDVENDFPDPQITPHKLELITCSCLNSCDPFVVLNCSKRFKGSAEPKSSVIQTFQDSSEKMLTEIFNRNCFLVLGCYRFWLLKKLRHILLVWHYNNGPGLILLPDQLTHSGNLNNPVVSYQDFHIGNVYTSESLLQLPDNQLQANVQKEIHDHLNEIKDSLESKYASSLNNFIHGSTVHHNPITEKTCIECSNYSIKLWDARVSRFNLVESNYIHFNLSTPYKSNLGNYTRCSVSGYLVLEPAEGSLVKDIILDWYNHESRRLKCCSLKNLNIFTDEQKSTRIFYLWISDSVTSTTLIPCICLVDVISPIELIYEQLFAISSTSNFLSTTGFGVYIMIDQGLFFDSFILLDRFTLLKTENYSQHSLSMHSLKNSISKQIYSSYILLQSLEDVNKLRVHQIVSFSGTLIRVDTSRSHVWPICPYCSCANFEIYSDNNDKIKYFSKQENLKCVRCLSLLSNPLQRLELEVQVSINFDDDQSAVNKLKRHKSSVELTLNMASWRLCKLLNVTQSNLLKESGLNAQELVNRHLDNVIGVVVHIPNKVFPVDNVQKCNGYLRNIYVIELDQMKNGN
ncbi:unnamed protein product [Schistosoma rodhaini]|uniref:DUF4503 domain-containing protein n=1 Tax=Schistosoma rodhaini TaxID=6188 RepID=A0AA85EPP1_9TREM|nr:unnamed protein product [Schistosoma rodhaini]CAH8681973.1 unnamed protein product [Schistosoma rodhaini]